MGKLSKLGCLVSSMTLAAGLCMPPSAAADVLPVAIGVNVASDDNAAALQSYVSAAGRTPAIVMWYTNWAGPLYYAPQMPWADQVGATPMITWDPATLTSGISLDAIAQGYYDSYIDASATMARQYGKPLLIRFAHEMNLAGSPFGPGHPGDTPASFVAAWRHVVSRFAALQATNVRWVWSPNVNCGGQCPFDDYYPGDAYVDYTALDGYNYSTVHQIAWMSFSQIFGSSYADITHLSPKPVIIAETASAEVGGSKVNWMTAAFDTELPTLFPRVVAVVWFDRVKETDWRVDSTASSLSEWQHVVSEPRFQGRLFVETAAASGAAPAAQTTASSNVYSTAAVPRLRAKVRKTSAHHHKRHTRHARKLASRS